MDEEPRPPSLGLRIMAVFVGLFAIAALIVLPMTMGTWDATGVVIAVAGVAIVGIVAIVAVQRAARRRAQAPEDEETPEG